MKKTNDAPLTPDQILSYDNVPASSEMPIELKRRLTTPRLIVSADKDFRFGKPEEYSIDREHVYEWSYHREASSASRFKKRRT